MVGRESHQVRLTFVRHSDGKTLRKAKWPGARVHTDEWRGYDRLAVMGRIHATVCHNPGECAGDDGAGIREVHDNTLEGLWTGLRNFLRPFRGLNKEYLHHYVVLFEWRYNVKRATMSFLRAMLGMEDATKGPA